MVGQHEEAAEWEGEWEHPYKGVSFQKRAHKTRAWRAQLRHQGQLHWRYGFPTAKAAALAYDEMARGRGLTKVNFPATPEETLKAVQLASLEVPKAAHAPRLPDLNLPAHPEEAASVETAPLHSAAAVASSDSLPAPKRLRTA